MEEIKQQYNKQKFNRPEYIKNYMRDYIKRQPKIKCDVCDREYNKHQKYSHDKQKNHMLHLLIKENLQLKNN
jgi:hypothetical protein